MNNSQMNRSRRKFLDFIAKSGVTAPALKSSTLVAGLMANRFAQANEGVKRVVFVYTPLGVPQGLWLPHANGMNAATKPFEGLQSLCHFHQTYINGGGFGLMWKALGEVRFVRDWTGDTIDHQIGSVLGMTTPFPTLHLGVQSQYGAPESFSRKNQQPALPLDSPAQAYDTLFGQSGGTAPPHFRHNLQKQNILDAHLEAINCSRQQLSSAERLTIEHYESSLNALKAKLGESSVNAQACFRPAWNAQGFSLARPTAGRPVFLEEAFLQAEILTHALACGLTNVATLQLSDDYGSFIPHDTEFRGDMHQATCSSPLPNAYVEVVNYLNRCIVYLIEQLAERDDPAVPGTKLIDNTVVVQVSNQGDGPNHNGSGAPILIATKMPSFRTGIARLTSGNNLRSLQTVAVGLGLEAYIGQESHHCIWPCGRGIDTDYLI